VDVDAKPSVDGVDVRVLCDEPALEARAAAVDDLRKVVSLTAGFDKRTFSGHLVLAPGHHRLRIVVADAARNESTREVEVDVASHGPGGSF
jgi:hypothetical protein